MPVELLEGHDTLNFVYSVEDVGHLLLKIDGMRTPYDMPDARFKKYFFEFPKFGEVNTDVNYFPYQDKKIPAFKILYLKRENYIFEITNYHIFNHNKNYTNYLAVKYHPAPPGYTNIIVMNEFGQALEHFQRWLNEIQLKLNLEESYDDFKAGKDLDNSGKVNCDLDEPMRPVEKDALLKRLDIIIELIKNQEVVSDEEKKVGIDTVEELKITAVSDISKKDFPDTVPSKFRKILHRQLERSADKVTDEGIKIVWGLIKAGLITVLHSELITSQIGVFGPMVANYSLKEKKE